MGVQQTPYSLRLEPELMEKIKQTANKNRRSLNKEIELAVQNYVDEYEQAHGPLSPTEKS